MGKNRPIVVATLGYIIGIIWGLYFNINIVFFYALILTFLIVARFIKKKKHKRQFKFISIQRILRYIKLILDFKSLIIIILFSSISNFIVIKLNNKYENLYVVLENVNIMARIVDNGTNKEYKTTYKIKVENLNEKSEYRGIYLYLDVNRNAKINLKYGDYIKIKGEYKEPSKATNYQGLDFSKYLKTLKIYGTIEAEEIYILKQDSNNILFTLSNNIFTKIKQIAQENLPKEKASLLLGILIGYKDNIPEEMQENFKESNISHILAVSGLHVSYIILAITKILEKTQGKRTSKLLTIFFIIAYMFITNFSPSVVRAGIMGIISILAKLTYNKNDICTSIGVSLLCILIYNPYLLQSSGVLLSYLGTIGIVLFQKNVSHSLNEIKTKSKNYKYKVKKNISKLIDYIQETVSVSCSAQLAIAPIMAIMFNTISFSFFITNFFVSIIIGPIIILGFVFIILSFLLDGIFIHNVIKLILDNLLNFLLLISKLGKSLPLNKIYVSTPEVWQIAIYYLAIFIINIFSTISRKRKITVFQKRIINLKNLGKHLVRKNRKTAIMGIICIVFIIFTIKIVPNDLKIYFIDVGQGDATLIVTPSNKTILIDGGGSENYDVGKNILLPYLLDRKITKIDYMIISHFDTDHVGGLLTILKELKVEKVIIGKQYEMSENYEKFLKLVKKKNIFVKQVEKGDTINIEKNVKVQVIFPNKELISENALNNNSLVFKFICNKFWVLFTGDIEEIAEKELIKLYGNTEVLKATVLKVAHHGSKSSSIEEFLELVEPDMALIGVGKNNLYGHPNLNVIESIEKLRCKSI